MESRRPTAPVDQPASSSDPADPAASSSGARRVRRIDPHDVLPRTKVDTRHLTSVRAREADEGMSLGWLVVAALLVGLGGFGLMILRFRQTAPATRAAAPSRVSDHALQAAAPLWFGIDPEDYVALFDAANGGVLPTGTHAEPDADPADLAPADFDDLLDLSLRFRAAALTTAPRAPHRPRTRRSPGDELAEPTLEGAAAFGLYTFIADAKTGQYERFLEPLTPTPLHRLGPAVRERIEKLAVALPVAFARAERLQPADFVRCRPTRADYASLLDGRVRSIHEAAAAIAP